MNNKIVCYVVCRKIEDTGDQRQEMQVGKQNNRQSEQKHKVKGPKTEKK